MSAESAGEVLTNLLNSFLAGAEISTQELAAVTLKVGTTPDLLIVFANLANLPRQDALDAIKGIAGVPVQAAATTASGSSSTSRHASPEALLTQAPQSPPSPLPPRPTPSAASIAIRHFSVRAIVSDENRRAIYGTVVGHKESKRYSLRVPKGRVQYEALSFRIFGDITRIAPTPDGGACRLRAQGDKRDVQAFLNVCTKERKYFQIEELYEVAWSDSMSARDTRPVPEETFQIGRTNTAKTPKMHEGDTSGAKPSSKLISASDSGVSSPEPVNRLTDQME